MRSSEGAAAAGAEAATKAAHAEHLARLSSLQQIQQAAVAINLELCFQSRLPDVLVSRHLPRHASHVLPRALAVELRSLAVAPQRARLALEAIAEQWRLRDASAQQVGSILDRVQRAAEIWQHKAERYQAHRRQLRPSIYRGAIDARHGAIDARDGAPSKPSRLLRLFGLARPAALSEYFASKALIGRALALAIRQRRPELPQTAFERAKVAHNRSISHAMLEAYSRALATHSQSAVRHYQALVDQHPHPRPHPHPGRHAPASSVHVSTS